MPEVPYAEGTERKLLKMPYFSKFVKEVSPGQVIIIKGFLRGASFNIGLHCGKQVAGAERDDIALMLSARLEEEKTTLSSLVNGEWSKEEDVKLGIQHKCNFGIRIRMREDCFEIWAQQKKVIDFEYTVPLQSVQYIYMMGEIDLYRCDWEGRYYPDPFCCYLPPGALAAGCSLWIAGFLHKDCDLFEVDIKAKREFVLQLNARLGKKTLSRNATIDGEWAENPEKDLKKSSFPLERGMAFEAVIHVAEDCFQIYVNEKYICSFQHRYPIEKIDNLVLEGQADIHAVSWTDGTPRRRVIISEDGSRRYSDGSLVEDAAAVKEAVAVDSLAVADALDGNEQDHPASMYGISEENDDNFSENELTTHQNASSSDEAYYEADDADLKEKDREEARHIVTSPKTEDVEQDSLLSSADEAAIDALSEDEADKAIRSAVNDMLTEVGADSDEPGDAELSHDVPIHLGPEVASSDSIADVAAADSTTPTDDASAVDETSVDANFNEATDASEAARNLLEGDEDVSEEAETALQEAEESSHEEDKSLERDEEISKESSIDPNEAERVLREGDQIYKESVLEGDKDVSEEAEMALEEVEKASQKEDKSLDHDEKSSKGSDIDPNEAEAVLEEGHQTYKEADNSTAGAEKAADAAEKSSTVDDAEIQVVETTSYSAAKNLLEAESDENKQQRSIEGPTNAEDDDAFTTASPVTHDATTNGEAEESAVISDNIKDDEFVDVSNENGAIPKTNDDVPPQGLALEDTDEANLNFVEDNHVGNFQDDSEDLQDISDHHEDENMTNGRTQNSPSPQPSIASTIEDTTNDILCDGFENNAASDEEMENDQTSIGSEGARTEDIQAIGIDKGTADSTEVSSETPAGPADEDEQLSPTSKVHSDQHAEEAKEATGIDQSYGDDAEQQHENESSHLYSNDGLGAYDQGINDDAQNDDATEETLTELDDKSALDDQQHKPVHGLYDTNEESY